MTEDETLAGLFHDPAARAAGPPRHDAAAAEFRVSTTTLNRLLVWAWAMAGTTQPEEETQANTTARIQFRLLAHRAKDFTTRYVDILPQAAENAATPSATPRPTEPETPAYGSPPKALQALLERHQSPPQPATLTQTQGTSSQTATTAGGQREPGWSFVTAGPSASADASKTAGTTDAQPPKATDPANKHNSNTGHDEGSGNLGPSAASTKDGHTELEAGAKKTAHSSDARRAPQPAHVPQIRSHDGDHIRVKS